MRIIRHILSIYILLILLIITYTGNAQSSQVTSSLYWYSVSQGNTLNILAFDPTTQQSITVFTVIGESNSQLINPVISSNGDWLAYQANNGQTSNIYIVDIDTEQTRLIVDNLLNPSNITRADPTPGLEWSSNGQYLLIRGEEAYYLYEPGTNALEAIAGSLPFPPGHIQWLGDGDLLVLGDSCVLGVGCVTSAMILDVETLNAVAVYDSGNVANYLPSEMCEMQLSPDNRYLAYMADCSGTSGPDIEREVYVYDTQTDQIMAVTDFTEGVSLQSLYTARYDLAWKDNETLLIGAAYDNALGEIVETFQYNIDSQTQSLVLPVYGQDWAFSPNGSLVAYRAMTTYQFNAATYQVRIADVQNLSTVANIDSNACNFAWSPDGDLLAYSVHEDISDFRVCEGSIEKLDFVSVDTGAIVASITVSTDKIIPLGWVEETHTAQSVTCNLVNAIFSLKTLNILTPTRSPKSIQPVICWNHAA